MRDVSSSKSSKPTHATKSASSNAAANKANTNNKVSSTNKASSSNSTDSAHSTELTASTASTDSAHSLAIADLTKPSASAPSTNSTHATLSTDELPATVIDPSRWLEIHGSALYNFAFHRLRHHELAEEAVQETMLSAIRKSEQFVGYASERTWLFAILRRKVCDTLRRSLVNKTKVSIDDEATPENLLFDLNGSWREGAMANVHGKLESHELRKIVFQCLRKLPRIQAEIFMLRVLEEKETVDICKELDISANNYWTRLHRARLGLAKCVSENWPLDGESNNAPNL